MNSVALSKMPDTDLMELEQISAGMQDYIRAANAESQKSALEALSRRSVWQRLLPSPVDKEQMRVGVQSIRQLGESKRELLEVYSRAQIEIARKRADALIAAQGMHLQGQLTLFASGRIEELNNTINKSRERFMESMAPQFTMIERFQERPELYEPAYEAVNQQISVYFQSTAALLQGFVQSLTTRVGQVQR